MTLQKCVSRVACGVLLVAAGVYFFILEDGGLWEQAKCLLISLAGLAYAAMEWYTYREETAKHLSSQARVEAACVEAELPHSLLAKRFRWLAERDELVNADDPNDFLGWKSHGEGDFHLFPISTGEEGHEGDGWLALWWGRSISFGPDARGYACVRSVKGWDHMRDAELEALCRRHGIPMQDCYRQMKPTGLALYRSGKLTVYPAAYLDAFRDSFMDSVLAPQDAFHQWAEVYYAEEEQDGGEESKNDQ